MNTCQCAFCGQTVELIQIHGHYQCPVCKTNAMPCCDGDNCDTNILLRNEEKIEVSGNPSIQYQISNVRFQIN